MINRDARVTFAQPSVHEFVPRGKYLSRRCNVRLPFFIGGNSVGSVELANDLNLHRTPDEVQDELPVNVGISWLKHGKRVPILGLENDEQLVAFFGKPYENLLPNQGELVQGLHYLGGLVVALGGTINEETFIQAEAGFAALDLSNKQ